MLNVEFKTVTNPSAVVNDTTFREFIFLDQHPFPANHAHHLEWERAYSCQEEWFYEGQDVS